MHAICVARLLGASFSSSFTTVFRFSEVSRVVSVGFHLYRTSARYVSEIVIYIYLYISYL